ncbi:gluconeogenesis factor [Jeotgalicoccus coquinae]|uniref:Gluconeogenesis factor n=1 Tax=Jeotgalicoccus coquinae TaxID=709509 RepID=A0A6V7RLG5_9STAP|nr:uridine diphosphate-N-acetylglucosamine-binding protein YvcK [Jeotgalicoccus coquinae]MBB6422298.1 putative cofD-like protein [Jeotgalicoccus coquinae]GGE17025.1 gluconeogenesis factor [Jeotgalicoccus coquinae]CAD2079030.1 Gluconeogenesis factor [Jeotgalicoccus coquinae]
MKKIKIAIIGGGTGLAVLSRGLKNYPVDISAIVSVADDGGSTGIIRDQIDMPAPGDIRNVMSALSEVESKLEHLFTYRFKKDEISGHSLGNLMLAAMYDISGDFATAVSELSKILNVKGTVIPSTNVSPKLAARMADDSIIIGESYIPKVKKEIKEMYLIPTNIDATPAAVEAILEADIIVLGPGSLYTSIIPNLLPKGIAEAVTESQGIKVYVSNLLEQPGETMGMSAFDHLYAIEKHLKARVIDYVILNERDVYEEMADTYKNRGVQIIKSERDKIEAHGVKVITDDELIIVDEERVVRHNNEKLAEIIYDIVISESETLKY